VAVRVDTPPTMSTNAAVWTCPNCQTTVDTHFCPTCGERPVRPLDLSAKGIVAQVLKTVGGVDGRVVRSVRELLLRPGALTVAYEQGRRKPLVGPFQLFLLTNVVFFLAQSLTHTKIFSSALDSHLHHQDWSAFAQQLVAQQLAATDGTLERLTPLFDQAVVLNAKSLIVLMVFPFALLLPLFFRASRRPFAVNVVFSLHLYAFLLLLFCAALGVVAFDRWLGGAGLDAAWMDNTLSAVNLLACTAYLFVASGRVYGGGTVSRLIKALLLSAAVGAIVLGYRFVVFMITLYTI
jgi:hypothetical protein